MSHYSFDYNCYSDDDCKYPVQTHWLIEFDRERDTPGDAIDPVDRGAITITAKHLASAVCWVGDYAAGLDITDYKNAEREFGKSLDEELLIEAAHEWYERYGRDLDDEGRRVA